MARSIFRLAALFALSFGFQSRAADIFVSPIGNDANAGTKEKPFASLEKARDAVRAAKRGEGTTIHLLPGTHYRTTTFTLGTADSGTKEHPIIYRAEGDARIVAGRIVPKEALKPVSDAKVLALLDPSASGKIRQIDLKALGVSNIRKFRDVFQGGGGIVQVFQNDARLPIARWPNNGYTTVKEVLDSGMLPKPRGGMFIYRDDRASRWADAAKDGRLWVSGFWRVPWVIETVRVEELDTAKKQIKLAAPVGGGLGSKYSPEVNGTRKGDGKEAWYTLNLVEEIDRPGEWSIDFAKGILYVWPPADAPLVVADLETPIVSMKDASYVHSIGLKIEGGLGEAVRIEGGEGNLVAGCTIRNTTKNGITVVGGRGHGIQSCDLFDIGAEGISIAGGDRKNLSPAGHYALNNHVHHYGQVSKIVSGLVMDGVGNRAANNLIHDGTYGGVLYHGNDHMLERNEIHNIGLDGGDLGGFYSNADWGSRGTVIRHNFIHHAPNANGIYMDDGHSGEQIIGNIMYRVRTGPFIGGGHDNRMHGNVVVECEAGVHIDDRGIARKYTPESDYMMKFLKTVDYKQPPWSTRYPTLSRIFTNPTLPTDNVVERNAFIGCKAGIDYRMAKQNRQYVTATENMEAASLIGLVDPTKVLFKTGTDSPLVGKLAGFEPIPFESIGLRIDTYRKTLPTAQETGRNENRKPMRSFDSNTDVGGPGKKP